MRVKYKSEACLKEEGTLNSVTNIEVSYEEAEQSQPTGPRGDLQKLGPNGGSGTVDEGRRQVDDRRRAFARPSRRARSIFCTRTRGSGDFATNALFDPEESRT